MSFYEGNLHGVTIFFSSTIICAFWTPHFFSWNQQQAFFMKKLYQRKSNMARATLHHHRQNMIVRSKSLRVLQCQIYVKDIARKKVGFSKLEFIRGWWSDYFKALKILLTIIFKLRRRPLRHARTSLVLKLHSQSDSDFIKRRRGRSCCSNGL